MTSYNFFWLQLVFYDRRMPCFKSYAVAAKYKHSRYAGEHVVGSRFQKNPLRPVETDSEMLPLYFVKISGVISSSRYNLEKLLKMPTTVDLALATVYASYKRALSFNNQQFARHRTHRLRVSHYCSKYTTHWFHSDAPSIYTFNLKVAFLSSIISHRRLICRA